ncbi:phosphoribosyl-ATP diphosphatase [Calditerrivibrio nitroreducens]|uniref:Phosphoribosyl-ATP pyrophosphatase n=1 Tax=Calditerrivibrio nitroreducens (strain DSM 19672 / NBRC 101217 / Yu37-1) TaxID=768670 RepID=E4TJL6_CALNY|nr:phosphoribosyl-ATP diphosphatase [Calditerrivibrio nitroreducens]ADR18178.1 phosphoribosyl-ATP diphosphatase [Calditerrivibrio nitroreducens DSM 19672]
MKLHVIEHITNVIRDRKQNPKEGSYTNLLFSGGDNKIIKKLGEENAEFLKAFLTETGDRIASEAADIIYHLIVALEYKGVGFEKVLDELESRIK